MADLLWRQGTRDENELVELLSLTAETVEVYLREAKRDEKAALKADIWDRWLNVEWESYRAAAEAVGIDHKTAKAYYSELAASAAFSEPPESRQHFDVWSFGATTDDAGTSSYFGKMPPQMAEERPPAPMRDLARLLASALRRRDLLRQALRTAVEAETDAEVAQEAAPVIEVIDRRLGGRRAR